MLSSRRAACSAVNLAGSEPRQRSSRESSVMKFCCSSPLQKRGLSAKASKTCFAKSDGAGERPAEIIDTVETTPPLKRRATATSLPLDGERDGVAASEAQRGDSAMRVAALQFVQQRREDARAGSADRMADSHGAAVYVYFRGIEMQLARHGNRGGGKRFVEFVQVHVAVAFPACLFQDFFDGVDGRSHNPFGIDAAHGLRDDARHRSPAEARRGPLARDHQRRRAVIGARGVAGGHCAILLESRPQFAQGFERSILARRLVELYNYWIALLLRNLDRHNLGFNEAGFSGANGALVALQRKLILLRPGDAEFLGHEFGGDAHVKIVVYVPQTVAHHRVHDFGISVTVTGARARQ